MIERAALDALATKRIVRLVVDDAILDPVREKIWRKFPPESSKIGYVITCHSCSSVWAAAVVRSRVLPRWVRDTLALSEMALAIQSLVDD